MEDMQRLLAHREEIKQIKKMFKQKQDGFYNIYFDQINHESFQNIRRVSCMVCEL